MMYRARVEAVAGTKVLAGGKWLTCIGNRAVRAGDFVWTDGRCAYGHDQTPQTPLVIVNPEKLPPIPLFFFDTVPTSKSQTISEAGYTLFPNSKNKLDYLGTTTRNISQNLFMVNNKTECEFPPVVVQKDTYEYIADVAVNLDSEQNFYEVQKVYRRDQILNKTLSVRIVKNGQVLTEIDCNQKVKEFQSGELKYARENVGGSLNIPHENWVIVYDPNSLHLYKEVVEAPANAVRYRVVFPPILSWEYYGIEYGHAYFDASIEGVIIRESTSDLSLYPGSPQNRPWNDYRAATSDSFLQDLGVPWGVIENEDSWAFMFSAFVYAYASGWYSQNEPHNAHLTARRTWLCTPKGMTEIYYSRFTRLDKNGTEIPTPKIEQSYPVSDLIPIQDGYYFTINGAQIYWSDDVSYHDYYWSGLNLAKECHNAVMLNVTVHDKDGGKLLTRNIVAGTYLTICKNKKIWLGVDDRGGIGLFDREIAGYEGITNPTHCITGDLTSGVYLLSEGQAELIIGGYLKNQKLRLMKKYKNWWEQIEGGEESE